MATSRSGILDRPQSATSPESGRPAMATAPGALDVAESPLVLRVSGPGCPGRIVQIRSAKCTIGSAAGCTLRLHSPHVPRLACWLVRGKDKIAVRKFEGCPSLNGAAFELAELKPGDRLLVGNVELELLPSGWADGSPLPGGSLPVGRFGGGEQLGGGRSPGGGGPPAEGRESIRQIEARLEEALRKVAQLERESRQGFQASIVAAERAEQMHEALALAHHELEETRAALTQARAELAQTQLQLVQTQAEFEQARAELARSHAELAQAHCELERLRSESSRPSSGGRLTERHAALEARAAELTTTAAQLAQRQAALDAQQTELDAQQAELETRRATLDARQTEIDAQQTQLDARQTELDTRQATLETWQAELDARQATLDQQQAQLAAQQAEWEVRQAARRAEAAHRADLQRQETELAARSEQLAARTANLMEQAGVLERQKSELEHQQAELARQSAALQAQAADLEAWEAKLRQRADELDRQASQIAMRSQTLDARAAELDAHLEEAQRRLEELERMRAQLVSCTAPARADEDAKATGWSSSASATLVMTEGSQVPTWEQNRRGREVDPHEPSTPAEPQATSDDEGVGVPSAAASSDQGGIETVLSRLVRAGLWREEPSTAPAPPLGPAQGELSQSGSKTPRPAGLEAPANALPFDEAAVEEGPRRFTAEDRPSAPPASVPDDEDESIEAYMARLLERVRGESGTAPAPRAAEVARQVVETAPSPAPAEPVSKLTPEAYVPRSSAPESQTHLSALREVANVAARVAVGRHTRRQVAKAACGKFVRGLLTGASGLAAAYWAWRAGSLPGLAGAAIGGLMGVAWMSGALKQLVGGLVGASDRPSSPPGGGASTS